MHTLRSQFKKVTSVNRGFTLVETLVAIFILVTAVTALMTVAKNNFYVVRYARNQMIATTLMQESLEYIRNDRDSQFQKGTGWFDWFNKTYNVDKNGAHPNDNLSHGCFSPSGCVVDPYATKHVYQCPVGGCPPVSYFSYNNGANVFYGYNADGSYPFSGATSYQTLFSRQVTMQPIYVDGDSNPDQILVTCKITWKNGLSLQTQSQSIIVSNWTK